MNCDAWERNSLDISTIEKTDIVSTSVQRAVYDQLQNQLKIRYEDHINYQQQSSDNNLTAGRTPLLPQSSENNLSDRGRHF